MSDEVSNSTKATAYFYEGVSEVKKFMTLNMWQYLVIIGIAVSGITAFVTIYNAASNVNDYYASCESNTNLKKSLNVKFGIMLSISVLIILFGILLAWFFRAKPNPRRILTLGIITIGLFGFLYAFSIKLQSVVDWVKLAASIFTLIGFLILGWYLSTKTTVSASVIVT